MFFLLCLIAVLASCSSLNGSEQTKNNPVFQIVILDKIITNSAPALGHDWQTAWPILQSAYPSQASYTITEYDIEHYDWTTQVITLNTKTSESVLQIFYDTLDDCGMGRSEKKCLLKQAFIVVYSNKPLYGGIFLPDYPMPTRYQYPIIYTSISSKGQLELIIRPYKSISKRSQAEDYKLYTSDEWLLIKDKSIEERFSQLGTLVK